MNIHFVEPPASAAKGGIALAMNTLEGFLSGSGINVVRDSNLRLLRNASSKEVAVHFHGMWQPRHIVSSWWCRMANIPYVVSPHGMLEPWAFKHKRWKKLPYFYSVEKYHLEAADRVLATSMIEARNLREVVDRAQVETIPLSLDVSRGPAYSEARSTLGWKPDQRVLLYLSRVHPKKGLHLLLEALRDHVSGPMGGLRLVVVGDGPADYVGRLRAYSDKHRAELPPTDWVGPVWGDDKWLYLQGADLFCLPTHSENFGLSVLEACHVGTPVLTTHQTPWGFLADWGSAWITEPAVGEIGEALQQFIHREQWTLTEREQLARRTKQQFALEQIGPQYLQLYRKII